MCRIKILKKIKYLFFGSGSKVETLSDGIGYFVTLSKNNYLVMGKNLI